MINQSLTLRAVPVWIALLVAGCAAPSSTPRLQIEDLQVGTGEAAKTGDVVEVHYTGRFPDGKEFDTSVGKEPYAFKLGAGRVIKGWDEGVVGMRVGGKRKLTVPPEMAYGKRGYPPDIPPDATLLFDIELLNIRK